MDRVVALLQRKEVLAGLAALVVLIAALTWWATTRGGDTEPAAAPTATTAPPVPTESIPTPTPTPTEGLCEGPDTIPESSGESLLPDCGNVPVTQAQQKASGLGLGCGGSYPVILYKTTAKNIDASICGKTSSGEFLRVVIKRDGEAARDLAGDYEYTVDGFVAKDGDTTWTVLAYDGSIVSKTNGTTTSTGPGDWMSLDNEDDGD